jgi:hypothetical protein
MYICVYSGTSWPLNTKAFHFFGQPVTNHFVCLTKGPQPLLQPHSATWCFCFYVPVSSHFVKIIQRLLTSFPLSSRPLCLSFHLSFNNAYSKAVSSLRKKISIQLSYTVFFFFMTFFSSLPYVILLYFSHDLCYWSPSFSRTTFQNFPGISGLLSEVSNFQRHTKPCSKCIKYLFLP